MVVRQMLLRDTPQEGTLFFVMGAYVQTIQDSSVRQGISVKKRSLAACNEKVTQLKILGMMRRDSYVARYAIDLMKMAIRRYKREVEHAFQAPGH